ncbi:uncharacterized domain 1 [Cutibacterium acnes JCM 18918]|nr:uncharacterized domain 1 [Cutibacterium acnes JCM 18918]
MTYSVPEHPLPDWLAQLVSPLDDKLGVKVREISPHRCVVTAPLDGNTQPMGLWHGGGSGVLVETAGSLAAMAHARTLEHSAVGTELSVSHLRPPHGHQSSLPRQPCISVNAQQPTSSKSSTMRAASVLLEG